MDPDRRASPNGMERFVSSVSAADGIRAISGKSGGAESATEHTERPEAVTEHTEGVGYVGGEGPDFCARCAAESEVQIPYATICGKEFSLVAVSAVMELDW